MWPNKSLQATRDGRSNSASRFTSFCPAVAGSLGAMQCTTAIAILALAALFGCHNGNGVKQYESDATEIVVKQLLRDAGTNEPIVLFLACGYRLMAPSDAFLARFADHRPPIKSYAMSKVLPTGDVVDRTTGKIGAMLQIANIERKTDTEFDVELALTSLPITSNRFVYTVVQQEGRWTIKSRKPL